MIKAILSDGGNILFDDNEDRNYGVNYIHKETGINKGKIAKDLERMKEYVINFSYKNLPVETQEDFKKIQDYLKLTSIDKKLAGDKAEKEMLKIMEKYKIQTRNPGVLYQANAGTDTAKDAYRALFQEYGLENFVQFEEIIAENSKRKRELFPGVKETIESLDGLVDFIIVTDAIKPGKKLYESLPRMGITRGVKEVVSYADVKCKKPAPKFFDTVLQKNGYQKEEVAFIGHDYDEVVGAYEYGIPHIILFNYDEKELPAIRAAIPEENLHIIPNTGKKDNFSEIKKILEKINAKSQG